MAINTSNIHGMNVAGSDSTPEQFGHFLRDAWSGAVSGLLVKQNSTPNMTVLVERGTALLTKNTFSSVVAEVKADTSVTISTANTSNPRIDAIVIYEDTSVTVTPYIVDGVGGRFKLASVVGTPAASPTAPSDGTVESEIGAGKPWTRLADVTVVANTTTIINSSIRDARTILAPSSGGDGWLNLPTPITAVTFNGNRSYDLTTSADMTGVISSGMRLRTTRSTPAPTQSTILNGTSQYWSKTTPAGMTFTDDPTLSAWVKLSSYPGTSQVIVSRYNGTSGWGMFLSTSGQVVIRGFAAGAGNYSEATSYQSVPLNKWVHIAAQLDMSAFTATPTTSYVMLDGTDIPVAVSRVGTNPTTLVQAGNLEIGSWNGGLLPFTGRIAQVAIFSAKVAQATMRGYMSQGLLGTETSLVSAYSFNGVATDLNTTNANNLTANGSATATSADSPFGVQAGGTISSTLDYGIVQKVTASTITTQVAEGCTIPTSGAVSAARYSSLQTPFGFPRQGDRWQISTLFKAGVTSVPGAGATQNLASLRLNLPVGEWAVDYSATTYIRANAANTGIVSISLSTSSSAVNSDNRYNSTRYVAAGGASTAERIDTDTIRPVATSISVATPYYLVENNQVALAGFDIRASTTSGEGMTTINAENAYL